MDHNKDTKPIQVLGTDHNKPTNIACRGGNVESQLSQRLYDLYLLLDNSGCHQMSPTAWYSFLM